MTLRHISVPPQRNTGYHTHSGDSVSVNIEDADMTNQDLGAPQAGPAQRGQRGLPSFTAYSKEAPRTHKASNVGPTPFHNVSFIFRTEPGRFKPSSRAGVPGYAQIMDNERVRGWRLVLEPGQTVAPLSQEAPGIRIVVTGGELVESVPGQPERAMSLKLESEIVFAPSAPSAREKGLYFRAGSDTVSAERRPRVQVPGGGHWSGASGLVL